MISRLQTLLGRGLVLSLCACALAGAPAGAQDSQDASGVTTGAGVWQDWTAPVVYLSVDPGGFTTPVISVNPTPGSTPVISVDATPDSTPVVSVDATAGTTPVVMPPADPSELTTPVMSVDPSAGTTPVVRLAPEEN